MFSHYKFQDIIYTIRPLTQETYDDLRNRFNYVYKLEAKKAIKEEEELLQNQLDTVNELKQIQERHDKLESEIDDMFEDMGLSYPVFDSLSKEQCVKLLNEYAELLDGFNEAKRKYEKTKSPNKYYKNQLKKKRDEASEKLEEFRKKVWLFN